MTPGLAGWLVAGVAAALVLVQWRAGVGRTVAVARACHELRGPLGAVRLGLELSERMGGLTSGRMRAIELELGRAALALDDLARAGRGVRRRARRVPLAGGELVSAAELVRDSVLAWSATAERDGACLRLRWDGPDAIVRGSRLRLAQATGNLIANAIEHGGGFVEVAGRSAAGRVRIEVTDGGPGLPAPVAELAAGPGLPGRPGRGRGLGLGLGLGRLGRRGSRGPDGGGRGGRWWPWWPWWPWPCRSPARPPGRGARRPRARPRDRLRRGRCPRRPARRGAERTRRPPRPRAAARRRRGRLGRASRVAPRGELKPVRLASAAVASCRAQKLGL